MSPKTKKKFPLSRRALGFVVAGAFLLTIPYIVTQTGYSSQVLIAENAGLPFDKALILVGRDNVDGSIGIIVNKPLPEEEKTKLSAFIRDSGIPVSYGGPLEVSDKIFVLKEKKPVKSDEGPSFDILDWDDAVKATPDLLDKIRQSLKNGEQRYRVFTGYAGWGPLQLEAEVRIKKSWYTTPSTHNIVFQNGDDTGWVSLDHKEKTRRQLSNRS